MKCAILAVVLLAAAVAAASFDEWAAENGKTYASDAEKEYRRSVFEANVDAIARKNGRKDSVDSAHFAPNGFADRTADELRRFYLRPVSAARVAEMKMQGPVTHLPKPSAAALAALPDDFSWVEKGAVTGVKNQASCGSCWAFGSVANMEGQNFLHGTGKLVSLSEQNLVDCDHECMFFPQTGTTECDEGCDGGMEPNAFTHVIKSGGIMSEADYPYKGTDGKCQFDKSKAVAHFSNWTFVETTDEDVLASFLYENGPVSVGVHADEWFYYSGGIFDSSCKTENDHAVTLVGWGQSSAGKKYWVIKNSWGTGWGIGGYIHLARGKNKCGILEMMSTVIV